MMKSDEMKEPRRSRPFLGQVLFYFGASIFAGAIGAGMMLFNEDRMGGVGLGITLGLILFGAALLSAAVRIGNFDRPSLSSKTGRSQLLMLLYVILGGALGIYVNVVHLDSILDGTFQPSRGEAIAGIALLAACIPVAVYQWKQFDDFQRVAMKDAAFWTINIYVYGYMAWAIGALGGLFPPVDHFVVFIVITFTFLGIWAFKRSG